MNKEKGRPRDALPPHEAPLHVAAAIASCIRHVGRVGASAHPLTTPPPP